MRKPPGSPVPDPGKGKRGVDGHLAYLLRQANAAVRLKLERSLGEIGVTLPQFLVMTMLRSYPGLSGAELARVALLTPQTIGLITRNLERLGAVRKERHPSHGRVLQLALTTVGGELLDRCRQRADAVENHIATGLEAGTDVVVRQWLVGLAADLEAETALIPERQADAGNGA